MECDFSKIVLLSDEIKLLKKLERYPLVKVTPLESRAAMSLSMRWKLAEEKEPNLYMIRRDGMRYLAYRRDCRRELWLKNLWIPIIVAFATTVLTNWLLPKLLLILQ